MARLRVTDGPFAGLEGELIEDRDDTLLVAVEVLDRRTEVDIPRDSTDLPPLPPLELPPFGVVLDEIEAWMRASAPEVHAAHGRTGEQDLRALADLGPGAHELVELYRRFGGTTGWQGFFEGCELVPLRSAFESREIMNGLAAEGAFYRWMPDEWWHPGWLPFLDNHSYDMYCVDLVGTMGGAPGQIVGWSKDDPGRPILAPSLGAWLGAFVVGRDAGHHVWSPDAGIQVDGHHLRERFLRRALPGYPKPTGARSRKDVEGVEPPPAPPRYVQSDGVGMRVVRQWWAPESGTVHALAHLPDRGLLAVGQYDWGGSPAGLSLVDPTTGEVVETLLGRGAGSAYELARAGARLVARRLRGATNEVVVAHDGGVRVVAGGLPTRMEAFMAVGDDAVAVAGEMIEVFALAEPHASLRRFELAGVGCVLGLSPDGALLVVGQRGQPLNWFDVETGEQVGRSEGVIDANRIEVGVAGDVWVAGSRESVRLDLATGERIEHDEAHNPFVVSLHRPTRRIAFAGYSGIVDVLDADTGRLLASDSTHTGRVYGLAWDSSGTRLWSGDEGGQIVERSLD